MLASTCASGQQPQPLQQPAPRERIRVYAPGSGIIRPRLLPQTSPIERVKECKYDWSGEVILSLLVDTDGRARNIMFQRPSGSILDPYAIRVASEDRFQPGTLNGKPVVVAESLQLKIEACLAEVKDAEGKISGAWVVRDSPRQRLKKPKNPPQEVVFAPLEEPGSEIFRKVRRPEYFGAVRSAPVILSSEPAHYTPKGEGAAIGGICKISLVVDAHGLPQNLQVLKSLSPGADQSALAAVSMYRFFPAIEDEEPVPAAIVVDVAFTPPGPDIDDDDYF
jgi:TonB family protein